MILSARPRDISNYDIPFHRYDINSDCLYGRVVFTSIAFLTSPSRCVWESPACKTITKKKKSCCVRVASLTIIGDWRHPPIVSNYAHGSHRNKRRPQAWWYFAPMLAVPSFDCPPTIQASTLLSPMIHVLSPSVALSNWEQQHGWNASLRSFSPFWRKN